MITLKRCAKGYWQEYRRESDERVLKEREAKKARFVKGLRVSNAIDWGRGMDHHRKQED